MGNKVTVCCPNCGHDDTFDGEIGYTTFGGFTHYMPSLPSMKLERDAQLQCDNCGGEYLMRFEVHVVAKTAPLPCYSQSWPV